MDTWRPRQEPRERTGKTQTEGSLTSRQIQSGINRQRSGWRAARELPPAREEMEEAEVQRGTGVCKRDWRVLFCVVDDGLDSGPCLA